jgi:hypothetical protein
MRLAIPLLLLSVPAFADPATVVDVVSNPGSGGWRFDVTLRHADTGWDDYADGWRVELPDGTILGTRELLHPHVEEQPFTRSLTGVALPEGTAEIAVRASTSVEGWGADARTVGLR